MKICKNFLYATVWLVMFLSIGSVAMAGSSHRELTVYKSLSKTDQAAVDAVLGALKNELKKLANDISLACSSEQDIEISHEKEDQTSRVLKAQYKKSTQDGPTTFSCTFTTPGGKTFEYTAKLTQAQLEALSNSPEGGGNGLEDLIKESQVTLVEKTFFSYLTLRNFLIASAFGGSAYWLYKKYFPTKPMVKVPEVPLKRKFSWLRKK